MIRWLARRIASALAEEATQRTAPIVSAADDLLQALRADIDALRAKIEAEQPLPASPDHAAIWNVIDDLSPEEGPMRRHLLRVAQRLLREPGVTPEIVAAQLAQGELE